MRSRRWFAVVPMLCLALGACAQDDPAMEWLLSQESGSPPHAGTLITGTFSLQISDVSGIPDFIFGGKPGDPHPLELHTIVLDATNPLAGSLVQIRELSGFQTGRVVFRGVTNSSGNVQGSFSIDPVTGKVHLTVEYNGESHFFDLSVTQLTKINRSLYIRTTMTSGTADPCAADQVAPAINLAANPTRLWPPNHTMVKVATGISASDNSGNAPSLAVTVSSNEPIDGLGDGDTSPDWNVVDNGNGTFDVWVRAERGGKGDGRTYTISASSTDGCQNSASGQASVFVPKSQSTK